MIELNNENIRKSNDEAFFSQFYDFFLRKHLHLYEFLFGTACRYFISYYEDLHRSESYRV